MDTFNLAFPTSRPMALASDAALMHTCATYILRCCVFMDCSTCSPAHNADGGLARWDMYGCVFIVHMACKGADELEASHQRCGRSLHLRHVRTQCIMTEALASRGDHNISRLPLSSNRPGDQHRANAVNTPRSMHTSEINEGSTGAGEVASPHIQAVHWEVPCTALTNSSTATHTSAGHPSYFTTEPAQLLQLPASVHF